MKINLSKENVAEKEVESVFSFNYVKLFHENHQVVVLLWNLALQHNPHSRKNIQNEIYVFLLPFIKASTNMCAL